MIIDKDITIEELVDNIPGSVKYLMDEGIKCIACGEPIWGTLEDAAEEKGFGQTDIERFVKELNAFPGKGEAGDSSPDTTINVDKAEL